MNSLGSSAPYQQRLQSVSAKAKALATEPPSAYSSFVATELFEASKSAPTPQTAVYVRMMHGLTEKFSDQPDLQKELWGVALQVAARGVPGSAGVALAKSVDLVQQNHASTKVADPWRNTIGVDLEEAAVQFCAHDMGQGAPQTRDIASSALKNAKTYANPTYLYNGIQDISDSETWNIAH